MAHRARVLVEAEGLGAGLEDSCLARGRRRGLRRLALRLCETARKSQPRDRDRGFGAVNKAARTREAERRWEEGKEADRAGAPRRSKTGRCVPGTVRLPPFKIRFPPAAL